MIRRSAFNQFHPANAVGYSCRSSSKRVHRNTAAFHDADVRSSVGNGLMENTVQSYG
jgi:hypothetical protein